jgi:hypothetical protein
MKKYRNTVENPEGRRRGEGVWSKDFTELFKFYC